MQALCGQAVNFSGTKKLTPSTVCTSTDGDDMEQLILNQYDGETLYNLSSPGLRLEDETYDNGTDGTIADHYSETHKETPPALPKRRSLNSKVENTYHYEEPLDTRTVMNIAYDGNLEIDDDTPDKIDQKVSGRYKVVAFSLGLMALSFVGGLAGGAVIQNTSRRPIESASTTAPRAAASAALLPSTNASGCVQCIQPQPEQPKCTCEEGMVVFSMQRPGEASCWVIANSTNGGPDMMQLGGLYLRAGPEEAVGTVLYSATNAANLTVHTETELNEASFGNLVGDTDTGVESPLYWRLSKQSIAASHGSYRGWKIKPSARSESAVLSTEAETRPVSLVLLPLVCRHPTDA